MAVSALTFDGVEKRFPAGGGRIVEALGGLSVAIGTGVITALLGPDGAGKTTLMRLAAGLLRPDAGKVAVFGHDTMLEPGVVAETIGYMPQRFGLYEELTVRQNLDLYADLQGLAPAVRRARFDDLLALTALGPFWSRRASALSGGMKQKLGLACALLRTPRLLLLDEPTVGVDPISRRELWAIIDHLAREGTTVLMSTAYLDEAERCHDLIVLDEGRLLGRGDPVSFRTPLAGRTFLVRDPKGEPRRLQQELAHRPGVIDAQLHGGEIRVLLADGSSPGSQQGEVWEAAQPRVEDAFVALLLSRRTHWRQDTVRSGSASTGVRLSSGVLITARNLRRSFGSFEAVKGISFDVSSSEVFGLLGANGAGKTTAFRMLCGLLPPTSGELSVAGANMSHAGRAARQRIGYVSQRFALYGDLSVAQNLRFFAGAYGLRGAQLAARLRWAEEEFGLGPYRASNAGTLSVGHKQRLALACALLHEPQILFLDEPTSGVDPLVRREFWARINTLAHEGVTIMVTTHFMEEAEYCDRLVLMSQGEVLAAGTPSEVRALARVSGGPEPTMEDAFIALVAGHEQSTRRAS
ncbi:MAG: ATP-binding cassette domain-containing protein [Gammaproteobacteria bacterium]|nr:ATP-binding cassette domain-containing protein [Gammaproteobacteria bacterium]